MRICTKQFNFQIEKKIVSDIIIRCVTKVPFGEICVHSSCRWMRLRYRESFKIHVQNSYSLTLHIWSGVSTILILQQPEWSTLCEALQSLLGTTAVPAGSVQEKRFGIPNLNLLIFLSTSAWRLAPSLFPRRCCHLFPAPLAKPWLGTALGIPLGPAGAAAAHRILLARPELAQRCNLLSGAKGTQGTLIPHLTTVGHMSWVAHPKEMLSAAIVMSLPAGIGLGVPPLGCHLSSWEVLARQVAAKLLHFWFLTTDLPGVVFLASLAV